MRILRRFAMVAVCVLGGSACVYAGGKGPTVVYPTGVDPTDVNNVQAAINGGGNVLLKATNRAGQPTAFNFDDPQEGIVSGAGQVILTADVAIAGEQVGSHQTTIAGGLAPIESGATAVKASITGIKFQGPVISAITIVRSSGIQIVGNEIDGVVPGLVEAGTFEFTEGDGIDVFGSPDSPVTGTVLIGGNYIHDLTAEFAFGIQFDSVAANTVISGNLIQTADTITNNPFTVDVEGIAIERSTGPAAITGNLVYVGQQFAYDAIGVYANGAPVNISLNGVYSESPDADGIVLIGSDGLGGPAKGVSVAENIVEMHDSDYGGISLYDTVTNCTIADNLVSGDAAYALDAQSDPDDSISQNQFLDNSITQLKASVASIYFSADTSNNFVRSRRVSVIDQGTNNRFLFY